jgi:hypothetical protein
MNTKDFVSFLTQRVSYSSLEESIGNSNTIAGISGQERLVPLPTVQEELPLMTPAINAVPLPSVASGRVVNPPPPPSYVSQLGDIDAANRDPLAMAESDFRSVPRLDGGLRFDPDEYVNRISRLNEVRVSRGLPPVNGVTPSTYSR